MTQQAACATTTGVLTGDATPAPVFVGAGWWGLHMALTQGLLAKLVAETVSPRSRGTAFALLYLGSDPALLPASLIAGALWSAVEPSDPLLAGAFSRRAAWLGVLAVRT